MILVCVGFVRCGQVPKGQAKETLRQVVSDSILAYAEKGGTAVIEEATWAHTAGSVWDQVYRKFKIPESKRIDLELKNR